MERNHLSLYGRSSRQNTVLQMRLNLNQIICRLVSSCPVGGVVAPPLGANLHCSSFFLFEVASSGPLWSAQPLDLNLYLEVGFGFGFRFAVGSSANALSEPNKQFRLVQLTSLVLGHVSLAVLPLFLACFLRICKKKKETSRFESPSGYTTNDSRRVTASVSYANPIRRDFLFVGLNNEYFSFGFNLESQHAYERTLRNATLRNSRQRLAQ